jgi:hypothetical protein
MARRRKVIKIVTTSVLVDDQEKACQFYVNVLGFVIVPARTGPVTRAVFDDTCGILIQIAQRHA